ncbi:hypothetical protein ACOT7R_09820 [Clostridium perfringens]|uniref:hypothetical protein n=1 Tax=Clostridium perfringens TaxID=1502 RepID=UPI000D90EA3F|nr:hypothetical protein CYK87_10445 [Clostridium perfringens]
MEESNIQIFEKELFFEESKEKIKISIELNNIKDVEQVKDFLETMFKEIKIQLFSSRKFL